MKVQTLKQILKVYQIPNGNFQKQHWLEAFNALDARLVQGSSIGHVPPVHDQNLGQATKSQIRSLENAEQCKK